ncbi:MAG: hypothetical protein ACXWNK_00675 [Vulcanimicrobiaceae bacterium]
MLQRIDAAVKPAMQMAKYRLRPSIRMSSGLSGIAMTFEMMYR